MSCSVQHALGSRSPDGLLGMVLGWQWPFLLMRGWAWGLGVGEEGLSLRRLSGAQRGPRGQMMMPRCPVALLRMVPLPLLPQ